MSVSATSPKSGAFSVSQQALLSKVLVTAIALFLVMLFLAPLGYMFTTAIKSDAQMSDPQAPILWPNSKETFSYDGKDLDILQVPLENGEVRNLAVLTKGRQESTFIDPETNAVLDLLIGHVGDVGRVGRRVRHATDGTERRDPEGHRHHECTGRTNTHVGTSPGSAEQVGARPNLLPGSRAAKGRIRREVSRTAGQRRWRCPATSQAALRLAA